MKKPVWPVVSVGLNVVLLGVVWFLAARKTPPPRTGPAPAVATPQAAAVRRAQPVAASATTPPPPAPATAPGQSPARAGSWSSAADEAAVQLEWLPDGTVRPSVRFAQLLEQLRALGVAEYALAELIDSRAYWEGRKRRAQLQRRVERGELDPEALDEFSENWRKARENAVKEFLGEQGYRAWKQQNQIGDGPSIGGVTLTREQWDAYSKAQAERGRLLQQLHRAYQAGEIDPSEHQQQYAAIESEHEQKLVELLGAERYAQIQKTQDWRYRELQRDLQWLGLSDGQLDALYFEVKSYERQRLQLGAAGGAQQPDVAARRQQLELSHQQALERILGPEAYAQYRRLQDYRYKHLKQFAPAWQLSQQDIDYVYTSLQNFEKWAQDVFAQQLARTQGAPVDWQAVQSGIAEEAARTEQQLRNYLGQERFDRLRRAGVIQLRYPATSVPPGASIFVPIAE